MKQREINGKWVVVVLVAAIIVLGGCKNKSKQKEDDSQAVSMKHYAGDNTVYGLTCEGSTDSVLMLLPLDGSDPVKYNIIRARRLKRVLGTPHTGDWTAVVVNAADSLVADEVLDLDDLQGIWCYIVFPKLRSVDLDDRRAQARAIAALPDSIKELYIIPREYGFTMQRNGVSQSVGYVSENTTLGEESPVVYPQLGYFVEWHIWNGQLVIGSEDVSTPAGKDGKRKVQYDTCRVDYLDGDSLVLSSDGVSRSYYRKSDLKEVNVKAKKVAEMLRKQALEATTN